MCLCMMCRCGLLFDTPAATEVDVVLREVVAIHNLRQKIGRLAAQVEGLAAHGPMKVPEQQGRDDETPLLEDYDVKDGTTKARAPPASHTAVPWLMTFRYVTYA